MRDPAIDDPRRSPEALARALAAREHDALAIACELVDLHHRATSRQVVSCLIASHDDTVVEAFGALLAGPPHRRVWAWYLFSALAPGRRAPLLAPAAAALPGATTADERFAAIEAVACSPALAQHGARLLEDWRADDDAEVAVECVRQRLRLQRLGAIEHLDAVDRQTLSRHAAGNVAVPALIALVELGDATSMATLAARFDSLGGNLAAAAAALAATAAPQPAAPQPSGSQPAAPQPAVTQPSGALPAEAVRHLRAVAQRRWRVTDPVVYANAVLARHGDATATRRLRALSTRGPARLRALAWSEWLAIADEADISAAIATLARSPASTLGWVVSRGTFQRSPALRRWLLDHALHHPDVEVRLAAVERCRTALHDPDVTRALAHRLQHEPPGPVATLLRAIATATPRVSDQDETTGTDTRTATDTTSDMTCQEPPA